MSERQWQVTVTGGVAGGRDRIAMVNLRVDADQTDTVAEIEYLILAVPALLEAVTFAHIWQVSPRQSPKLQELLDKALGIAEGRINPLYPEQGR